MTHHFLQEILTGILGTLGVAVLLGAMLFAVSAAAALWERLLRWVRQRSESEPSRSIIR